MSRHKTGYVISYHGILCHNMSYVTTIAASLVAIMVHIVVSLNCWLVIFKSFSLSPALFSCMCICLQANVYTYACIMYGSKFL